MSDERLIKLLINEGFKFAKNECCICYSKFIDNLSIDELLKLLNLNWKSFEQKYNLNEDTYNDDDFWSEVRCYIDRFECLTCRNVICSRCIQNIPQEDGATGDFTTKLTCPVCRTEDFRYKLEGKYLPVDILHDIKNRRRY